MQIIRDIFIISSLSAYVMFELSSVVETEVLGWFSDRDSMLSYKIPKFKTPFIFDMANIFYHIFRYSNLGRLDNHVHFGNPEQEGKMFYEAFNRIPDIICGTVTDYDFEKRCFSHQKYLKIMWRIFQGNPNCQVFRIDFPPKSYFRASVLSLSST